VSAGAVLGSGYSITADNTWEDTGLSITLPSAGTYLIDGTVRAAVNNSAIGSYIVVKLKQFDGATDEGDIADSETLAVYSASAGLGWQNSVSLSMPPIEVAASKVIKLYAWRAPSGTYAFASVGSDSAGKTRLRYLKIKDP
jgi:hypothetical protein